MLLLDVTPLTLGIETKGGVMTKLIERNTTIPSKKSEIFSTAEDNQPSVEVHVLQGEREMASGNKSLGKFQLTGIPPAARGTPQIEVTFDIDANGILNVSAKDLGTGKEQKIEIKGGSGLDESEVEQMIKDAESHAEEDRAQRELAEARNIGENAAYQAEKQLEELGDKVDDSNKQQIEAAIKDVRDSLTSEDAGEIRSKTDALQSAFQQVSQQIYEAAAQEQAASATVTAPLPTAHRPTPRRRSSTPRSWRTTRPRRSRSGDVTDEKPSRPRPRGGGRCGGAGKRCRGRRSGGGPGRADRDQADGRRVPRARAAHQGRLRQLPQARRNRGARGGGARASRAGARA